MNIVILGAGQVGGTLAENLVKEDNDITLVDLNAKRLHSLQHRLDIRTITGSAAHPDVLLEAGIEHADMIIAVTNSDEINMVGCQIAYSLFRTPTKIARIRSQSYLKHQQIFTNEHIPIDVIISPELLVTEHVKRLIENPGTSQVVDFADGRLQMVSVKSGKGGMLLGRTLQQVYAHLAHIPLNIVAIFRNEVALSLDEDTLVETNDEIVFVAEPHHIRQMLIALGRLDNPNQRIIIAGGGHIGQRLAAALEQSYRVKIIDHNISRCEQLAETLHKATILQGDCADRELLINENIEYTDVFCSITNDDEANIMSCLQAKKLGAKHVMALINRSAYVELIEEGSITHAISPHLATIGSILTKLRKGDMVNVYSLRSGDAEAIEVIVHGTQETSKVVGKAIGDIQLPPKTVICAVVRGEEIIMPQQKLEIQAEDHIILLVLNKRYVRAVESLFQVRLGYFN